MDGRKDLKKQRKKSEGFGQAKKRKEKNRKTKEKQRGPREWGADIKI